MLRRPRFDLIFIKLAERLEPYTREREREREREKERERERGRERERVSDL